MLEEELQPPQCLFPVHSPAHKLGGELAEDARGAVRPAGLAVAVRQRGGGGPAAVGRALLVPGTPLLARVECAADAHPSGEVGTVGHGGTADVVGRRGGTGRPLGGGTARRSRDGRGAWRR